MTRRPDRYVPQGSRATTVGYPKGCNLARVSQSHKVYLCSGGRLQLDSLKVEALVIAHQHAAMDTFPCLVDTARHTMSVDWTKGRWANPSGKQEPMVWLIIRVMT